VLAEFQRANGTLYTLQGARERAAAREASQQALAASVPSMANVLADPTTLAAIAGAVAGALQFHAARNASVAPAPPVPEPEPAPVAEASTAPPVMLTGKSMAVTRRDDLGRWVEASVATPGGAWTATPRRDELGRTRTVEYAGPNGAKLTMNVQLDELGRIERIAHA
jgi:hypothetical protein